MGAEFNEEIFEDMSVDELKQAYQKEVEECLYNFGHSGYSGTFAEKPDLEIQTIPNIPNPTEEEARTFADDRNDKWEASFAIKLDSGKWFVGGWCSS